MDSYWEVIEPLFAGINFHDSPEAFAHSTSSFERSSVLLFATHMCLAEVYNGGFLQLFWNNAGVMVPEGIEGFMTLGMPLMAAILRDAARTLGATYPRDREDRWDALLVASGRSESELMQMFEKLEKSPDDTRGFYLVFAEATRNLPFDQLEKQFLETAKVENGGFQEAATRFAEDPHLLQ